MSTANGGRESNSDDGLRPAAIDDPTAYLMGAQTQLSNKTNMELGELLGKVGKAPKYYHDKMKTAARARAALVFELRERGVSWNMLATLSGCNERLLRDSAKYYEKRMKGQSAESAHAGRRGVSRRGGADMGDVFELQDADLGKDESG